MRLLPRLLLPAVLAILLLPAPSALASPARATIGLDQSFGAAGRIVTALPLSSGLWFEDRVTAASAGDGTTLLADSGHVLRYLPDGSLDPAFGSDGESPIPVPAGAEFSIAGITETPGGGVLLLGTVSFPHEPIPLPGPIPGTPIVRAEAMLVRLDARGQPDPAFGSGGVLLSTLGIAPPVDYEGRPFSAPSLTVADVAVDAQGRIVLAGDFTALVTECRDYSNAPIGAAYVARLASDGSADESFGSGGLVLDPRLAGASRLQLGPGGAPLLLGPTSSGCERGPPVLAAYTAAGAPRRGFGHDGIRVLPGGMGDFTLDRRGRILFTRSVGPLKLPGRRGEGALYRGWAVSVGRLRTDGSRDRGFGRAGRSARILMPGVRSRPTAILAAPGGRILVAGLLATGDGKHRDGRGYFAAFGLARDGRRLLAHGHSALRIGFGANSSVYTPGALLQPDGRLLLFGPLAARRLPGGEGLALAAFRPGSGREPRRR